MSKAIESIEEVPPAPFYVSCIDTFLSGWGPARGKRNLCILVCDSEEEAEVVAANANGRSDMVGVRIFERHELADRVEKPGLMISLFDREEAEAWYVPGRW